MSAFCFFLLNHDTTLSLNTLFQLVSGPLCLACPLSLSARWRFCIHLWFRRSAHSSRLWPPHTAFFLFGVFWSSLQAPCHSTLCVDCADCNAWALALWGTGQGWTGERDSDPCPQGAHGVVGEEGVLLLLQWLPHRALHRGKDAFIQQGVGEPSQRQWCLRGQPSEDAMGRSVSQAHGPTWSCANQVAVEERLVLGAWWERGWEAGRGQIGKDLASHVKGLDLIL